MVNNIGQQMRIHDFIPLNKKSIVLELTNGLYGIDFMNEKNNLESIKQDSINAIILSPGHARRHYSYFCKKDAPALIIRADWSNYQWDASSIYPAQKVRHIPICSAQEIIRLGGSAAIYDVFFGGSDEDSVNDMQSIRQLITEGIQIGLPIIVNILPFGNRVDEQNFGEIALLGARMCLELGANIAAIPYLDLKMLADVLKSTLKSPIFFNKYRNPFTPEPFSSYFNLQNIKKAFDLGLSGIIIDDKMHFERANLE